MPCCVGYKVQAALRPEEDQGPAWTGKKSEKQEKLPAQRCRTARWAVFCGSVCVRKSSEISNDFTKTRPGIKTVRKKWTDFEETQNAPSL